MNLILRRIFLVLGLVLIVSCDSISNKITTHSGKTFGTYYSIKYKPNKNSYKDIQTGIDSIYDLINQNFSTYIPNSVLSKINKGVDSVRVDRHFLVVFRKATAVYKLTNGYFDCSIGSLVDAYGFGNKKGLKELTEKDRDSLLLLTGWDKIHLKRGQIVKAHPHLKINFNSIAKGYAIDVISSYFDRLQISDYLIEIGGEVRAKGINTQKNAPWKIGIQNPNLTAKNSFTKVIPLRDKAIASSGNYRKFRVDSITGKKYVHIINPLNGRASQSPILATSVIAYDAITADAWATALMAMPLELGQEIIEKQKELKAYWIVSDKDTIREIYSNNWSH